MNAKFLILLMAVAATFGWRVLAQTNVAPVILTNLIGAPSNLRDVNGQTYDITHSELWGNISKHEGLGGHMLDMEDTGEWSHWAGVVQQIKGTTVLYDIVREHFANEKWTGVPYKTSQEYVKSVVILNCPNPEKLVTGEGAEFFCMKTTNYVNRDGISFVTYDCGTKPTQDELRKWQDEEAERQQAAKKELDERRRIAAENAAAAKKATQAKVVKWNQEQADKGDPTGLLRMGELYRDGNGVPKDLDKAREYLTKASAAGSPDAADELTKLNQVSTNAPANSK